MNIHLGTGDVYLDGFVNVDVPIPGYSFLARERPDLVERNRTTLDHYYRYPYITTGPVDRLCVADVFMDARALKFSDECAELIVAVQVLEHFTPAEAPQVLREWHRVLRPGGRLFVDTIDFPHLAKLAIESEDPEMEAYYFRMIFGSHKNEYASHKDGYTGRKLLELLLAAGFGNVRDVGNPLNHPYPSLAFQATKP